MGKPALVKSCASVFREVVYNNRDFLSVGIIIAGYDDIEGGQVSVQNGSIANNRAEIVPK